jgi:predicted GIY-YIG superfamily endonuclease
MPWTIRKRLQQRDAIIAAKKKQLQIFIGYILELENDNWYVGISSRGTTRLYEHFCGFGSKWTKKHKPIKVHTITYVGDRNTASSWEKENTLSLMAEKGWKNVRGYTWCQLELTKRPLSLT